MFTFPFVETSRAGGVMMKERTVLASFISEHDASEAARQIRRMGVETTQIDQLRTGGAPSMDGRPIPIAGKIESLAALTLNTSASRDAAVLLSADPSASGMADRAESPSINGERNYLLTVICPEAQVDKVVQVIKENNGYT
jgi:hypothetical protein